MYFILWSVPVNWIYQWRSWVVKICYHKKMLLHFSYSPFGYNVNKWIHFRVQYCISVNMKTYCNNAHHIDAAHYRICPATFLSFLPPTLPGLAVLWHLLSHLTPGNWQPQQWNMSELLFSRVWPLDEAYVFCVVCTHCGSVVCYHWQAAR